MITVLVLHTTHLALITEVKVQVLESVCQKEPKLIKEYKKLQHQHITNLKLLKIIKKLHSPKANAKIKFNKTFLILVFIHHFYNKEKLKEKPSQ